MKKIIGLTGTTGSGKTTVSQEFVRAGFHVINCDIVAKYVVENNDEVLSQLCDRFGADIITNGVLDRRLLASRAFADNDSTQALNSITLPPIVNEILNEINSCEKDNIVLDAPTLFESGANKLCTATLGVICDDETRISRIINRDNITKEQALQRISAQKSNDFFKKNCTYIIENNSTVETLVKQTQTVINTILKG